MDSQSLSEVLRTGTGFYLWCRRGIVITSFVSALCMMLIGLYQMGINRHLPEPPSGSLMPTRWAPHPGSEHIKSFPAKGLRGRGSPGPPTHSGTGCCADLFCLAFQQSSVTARGSSRTKHPRSAYRDLTENKCAGPGAAPEAYSPATLIAGRTAATFGFGSIAIVHGSRVA